MMSAGLVAVAVAWTLQPAGGRPVSFRVALPAASFRSAVQGRQTSAPVTPHRFFDKTNLILTVVESGALLADGITTQRALRRYPDSTYEGDPLARPFVSHGWPGQVAGGALVLSADLGIRYLLHRANHHRVERWIPVILTSSSVVGAIHNAWLLGRLHDEIESRKAHR